MRVRDAVEEDGEALGTLADAPAEVMRNVVHDRTVRIAEDGGDDAEIVGFVGFDATPGTVRVTYLRGSPSACERLLDEPVRFARKEEMAVEALVPERETETRTVVEGAGFERTGDGPRFDGSRTLKYRLAPPSE
ncbi:hypothetical protein [Halorussus amylolyticus]|uniref:hypothetical protein n=1 Tax=Halorussus amylolyticus TaxID=1126242 RepID=UPI001047CAA5|nr:hypothetical protein [Halorussus amylolyticus]